MRPERNSERMHRGKAGDGLRQPRSLLRGSLQFLYRRPSIWVLGFCMLISGAVRAEVVQVPGVIHIDALNTGVEELSIAEAVDLAARARMGVAILTPHDNAVVAYGLPPLRNLLKMQVSRESIQSFGPRQYVETVRATDAATPEVIALDGAEATPAYYWEGTWSGRPTVRNLHKHLLVIGLPEAEDYARIPSMAAGFPAPFDLWFLLRLWPASVMLIGAFLMIHARRNATTDHPRSLKPGVALAVVGGLFFVNGFPFGAGYDPYGGDPGEGPYQAVIDYANARGAMTFWAHPEVTQRLSEPVPWPASALADSVIFETLPYTSALNGTRDYTGFAIFEEGMYVVGRPGGIWDQALIEYCAGVRRYPVWAIAEVDFEYSHVREGVGTSQTVFLLNERSPEGVLDALRRGAMYARRGDGRGLTVRDFRVSDSEERASAAMGGQITLSQGPRIRIDLHVEAPATGDLEVQVIRGGKPIRTMQATGDTVLVFDDPVIRGEGTTFYRFIVYHNNWPVLASNPVFVTIKRSPARNTEPDA